jgi:hypothetical protein
VNRPFHEQLDEHFQKHMGRIMRDDTMMALRSTMQEALRLLTDSHEVFCYQCPVEVVVFEGEIPGHVGRCFRVTDRSNILWYSIHKAEVDKHFPASLFHDGRPRVPDYSGHPVR